MAPQQRSAYALGEFPLPFQSWGDHAIGIASVLALLVRVPLRRNIGLGYLSKTYLAVATLFALGASWWGNLRVSLSLFSGIGFQNGNDKSLLSYTLFVFLPLAVWQHVSWLRNEKQGTETFRYWHGDGWWSDFLPLPQKYQDMGVDPLVAFIAGALLRYRLGCDLLGFWIMVAAVAFCLVEIRLFMQAKEQYRIGRDAAKEATVTAQMLSRPEKRSSDADARAASVPTGSDADIEARIERNRRAMMNGHGVEK